MDYLKTYSGKALLEQHSLDEVGVWKIYGEDPNCDFGGYHHEPHLTTVSGRLSDVVAYAEQLSGFWQWGSGGKIVKQQETVIKAIREGFGDEAMKKLREEQRAKIEAKIKELQDQLKEI